jgi:hypothetical protein
LELYLSFQVLRYEMQGVVSAVSCVAGLVGTEGQLIAYAGACRTLTLPFALQHAGRRHRPLR